LQIATQLLVDAYIYMLFWQSPQEWQTSVALPFVRIEGTTVEWVRHASFPGHQKSHTAA
jgi:hypothetical protein